MRVSTTSPFAPFCDGSGQNVGLYTSAEVEPQLAINPRNASNMVGVWQQDRWGNGSAQGIVAGITFDGGTTWQQRPMPFSHCGGGTVLNGGDYVRVSDPWVTFGADGIVYQAALSSTGGSFQLGSVNAIVASRSVDGGLTWSNPATLISDGGAFFNDKNAITADPTDARFVYATWDRLPAGGDSGPSYFARSADRALSWEPARLIYDAGTSGQTLNNQIVVLTDGTLVNFFTQLDVGANRLVTASIGIVRSTDKGVTWSTRIKIADVTSVGTRDPENGTRVRDGSNLGSIAAGAANSMSVVWQDARGNGGLHDDILYAKSTDGGSTWSAPVRINADASVPSFTPTVAVRADGVVGVTYYDFRSNTTNPATLLTDYWLTRSTDGITWREVRAAAAFDLSIAPIANGLFLGDYQALGTIGNVFVPFFAQTSNGDISNRTDVYSIVARNGSVASAESGVPVKMTGEVTKPVAAKPARKYRAEPATEIGNEPALRKAAHDNTIRVMETRVPGWNARRLREANANP